MKLSRHADAGLQSNHAHQIMRQRMHRGETHRISRVMFRAGQVAPLKQQHRQFLGGVDVIWRDGNEPLQQGQRRLLAARSSADLIEGPERARRTGRDVQHFKACCLRRNRIADGERLRRTTGKDICPRPGLMRGGESGSISQHRRVFNPLPQGHRAS